MKNDKMLADETDRIIAEIYCMMAKTDHMLAASNLEITEKDRKMVEINRKMAERDREIAKIDRMRTKADRMMAEADRMMVEVDRMTAEVDRMLSEADPNEQTEDGEIVKIKERFDELLTELKNAMVDNELEEVSDDVSDTGDNDSLDQFINTGLDSFLSEEDKEEDSPHAED